MRKLSALALLLIACWTTDARAIEFKNVRATYGPFGAPRPGAQMLPGDMYTFTFDIVGLKIDSKGIAKYEIALEVFDPKGKQVVKEPAAKKGTVVALGGNTVPEFAVVMLGYDQTPGKYKVVVTVAEEGSKTPDKLERELELLPKGFGIIQVQALHMGFVGQELGVGYIVVDAARDSKKMPKITVTTRVIDETTGKSTVAEPQVSKVPDDLAPEQQASVAKQQLVPVQSPMFLNRPGRFKVELDIRDEIAKKSLKFSYNLTVLDSAAK
jgi:hypothetical protein